MRLTGKLYSFVNSIQWILYLNVGFFLYICCDLEIRGGCGWIHDCIMYLGCGRDSSSIQRRIHATFSVVLAVVE